MKQISLFRQGHYSMDWIRDFYDQAGIWWGADPQEPGVHAARVATLERLCGAGSQRVLDLGAGPGATAACMADAGHAVVAVELSPTRARFAHELARNPRRGSLRVLEADFYTVMLEEHFDVVCCWEVFGLGSDADQRRLLRRIAREWLAPAGKVLVDVYNPARFARDAGMETRLRPLKGVPGSVEMVERCYFDAVQSRWIDEWQPAADPSRALAQAVRCYTPADLLLLLEGTSLKLVQIEADGQPIDFTSNRIETSGPLLQVDSYLAQLAAEN